MAVGLDSFGVTFLARELKHLLTGRAVGNVCLKEDKALIIYFEGTGPLNLVFVAEPTLPLLCASESLGRREELPHPPRLEGPLRGSVVTDVCQIELDRIILFTLKPAPAKSLPTGLLRLYFELVPPFPNMFLADGRDIIIEPLFKAGTRTRKRILDRADSYVPPPPLDKIHPVDVTPQALEALDWRSDPEVLSKVVIGVSPFLSREIAARARRHGSLYEVFSQALADYRQSHSAPCVFSVGRAISKSPPHRGVAWFRPTFDEVYDIEPTPTLNEAVERLTSEFLAVSKLEGLRSSAVKALAKEIRKWEKVAARAAEARQQRDEAHRLRKLGEVLIANMAKVKRGSREARLPDIYSPGQAEVTVPLDPRVSPQTNAEIYFKTAKKIRRRADRSAEQTALAESRLRSLRRLEKEAESRETSEVRMAEIVRLLAVDLSPKTEERGTVDERAERLGIKPRRYTVAGTWVVLVGRSARENDVLTHAYAAPSDLWFHARQAQGSHVILRREKRAHVPREAIVQAAAIAAHFSKARTSRHVPVSYTEKRYVKKVKKAQPGTAAMLREKVVFVTPTLP
jgi:predicted ribosome quality control (RQC) complex YloA/Tae2 family protein